MPKTTPNKIRPIFLTASAALHPRALASTSTLQIVHLPKFQKTLDKAHTLLAQDWFSAEGTPYGFDQPPLQTDFKTIVYPFPETIPPRVRPIRDRLAHKPPPKVF